MLRIKNEKENRDKELLRIKKEKEDRDKELLRIKKEKEDRDKEILRLKKEKEDHDKELLRIKKEKEDREEDEEPNLPEDNSTNYIKAIYSCPKNNTTCSFYDDLNLNHTNEISSITIVIDEISLVWFKFKSS